MSTPVSPLEQLEQQSATAQPSSQAAPASNLSPLEQLEQMSKTKQSQLTTEAIDPSTISTGGEGSNTDQQLMSEASQRDATKKGLIIGGTGAAAVGGLAAPALVASASPELVDAAGEPIVQATKSMLQKFGENYPELTKLAARLGFHGASAGSTVAAWELLKHITGQK
jgi:hypothetical protein